MSEWQVMGKVYGVLFGIFEEKTKERLLSLEQNWQCNHVYIKCAQQEHWGT